MESSRSPALIALAVALPVVLVVGVIVAAVLANRIPARAPVALAPVPAPEADGADCTALLAALPSELGGGENGSGDHGSYEQAELAAPAPPATRAWSGEDSDDPTSDLVVLRCGLDRPLGFDVASPLTVVNGVQWFQVSGADQGIDASTWFAVDRAVYVALTVPDGSGPTPVQVVSDTIAATLPAQPLDPAPLPN